MTTPAIRNDGTLLAPEWMFREADEQRPEERRDTFHLKGTQYDHDQSSTTTTRPTTPEVAGAGSSVAGGRVPAEPNPQEVSRESINP